MHVYSDNIIAYSSLINSIIILYSHYDQPHTIINTINNLDQSTTNIIFILLFYYLLPLNIINNIFKLYLLLLTLFYSTHNIMHLIMLIHSNMIKYE